MIKLICYLCVAKRSAKHMRKNKNNRVLKIFVLIAYIFCTLVLIVEAAFNGQTSSIQSNLIGDIIADVVNGVSKDQTKVIYPEDISIEGLDNQNGFVGDELQLNVTTLPENTSYKQKIFSSSNESIATVSPTGVVSFYSQGSVEITVKNTYNETIKDSIVINVLNVEPQNINFYIKNSEEKNGVYTLYLEDESDYRLISEVEPINTTFKNVTYSSSSDFFEITKDGYLKNLKDSCNEIVTITAKCGEIEKTIKVKVSFKQKVELERLELILEKDIIYLDETIDYSIYYYPNNSSYKNYEVICSNTDIVQVNNGFITGINVGKTIITILSSYDNSIYCQKEIEVVEKEDIQSFDISIASNQIIEGHITKINISNIQPNKNADISTLKYTSSNELVVKVDNQGNVYAINSGIATISVETDNGFIQTIPVQVEQYSDYENNCNIIGFELNTTKKQDIVLDENNKIQLNEYYFVDLWNYDNSGLKKGSKEVSYILQDGNGNSIINGSELVVNNIGEVSFYVHHKSTNIISELVTINICDSFNINIKSDKNINFVGQEYILNIENNIDKKFEQQNYVVNIFDEKGNKVTKDPIIEKMNDGKFKIKSIYNSGKYIIEVIPIVNGKTINDLSKKIEINLIHKYVESIDFEFINPATNEVLIINNQMKLSVNEIININFLVNNEVTKYDFNISSSDSNVVNVKNNQLIPLRSGEALITIKEENTGLIKQIKMLVSNIVTIDDNCPVVFDNKEIEYDNEQNVYKIKNGTSSSIFLNLTEETTYTNVIYSSNDERIVSIGSDGTITAHKVGTALINMVCDDGEGKKVEYQITIKVNKKNLIEDLSAFFYKVRKGLGHFAAFLVLGIFSTLTYFIWFKKRDWVISLPLNFITGFYIAFLTEFIQRYVPGRSGNFNDVIIDMSGFLLSSIIITVLWFVLIIVKNKKKNSST